MRKFHWRRLKQVYDPFAQSNVGEKVCHIMIDGIHYGLRSQQSIPELEQDYEKFEDVFEFIKKIPDEIAEWAGKSQLLCLHVKYGNV